MLGDGAVKGAQPLLGNPPAREAPTADTAGLDDADIALGIVDKFAQRSAKSAERGNAEIVEARRAGGGECRIVAANQRNVGVPGVHQLARRFVVEGSRRE